jgi:hypothetical protein
MEISLASFPHKQKCISTPGLKGMDYPQQIGLCRDLRQANPRFVDYVLKPVTDEMWNLIDGKRSLRDIVEYALLEFDLSTDPALWLPVFAGWLKAGLISLASG